MYELIENNRLAVAAIGYYIPNKNPEWLGTGFLTGEGNSIMTCAHVIGEWEANSFRRLPLSMKKNSRDCELSCWIFRYKEPNHYNIRFPVKSIAIYEKIHIESTYFGEIPDVAKLLVDTAQWSNRFGDEPIPYLEVQQKPLLQIGSEVAIVGYPSPALLLYSEPPRKFECLEPLIQFCRMSGILPFQECPMPHLFAFDTVFAKGSSGSPICSLSDGKVIAMASRLHPFFLPTYGSDNRESGYSAVPSSIGFGVPSNYFYGMAYSKGGEGKFDF